MNYYELRMVTFVPKIKIVGLSSEVREDQLVNDIIIRNPWVTRTDLSLIRTYWTNNQWNTTTTAIVNVHNGDVLRRLLLEKFIIVHRKKCRVYEFI